MMKNLIFKILSRSLCLGLLFCCSACNSWLDVIPEAEVNEKKMFETPEGFQGVVNGIYVNAAADGLYGGALLYRLTDIMAQYYNIYQTSHTYYELTNFNFEDKNVKPVIESVWLNLYFCIANCNILLQNLDKVSPDFFPVEYHYNMIKGEVLALRAFFHLDLLRLFAPAPVVQKDVLAIPYVDVYSNKITPHMTTQVVLEKIIRDLKEAKTLLKTADPISFDKQTYMNTTTDYKFVQNYGTDYFGSYRIYRMNYYAVTGLLARAYAYRNQGEDLKLASECALEVIDSGLFPFIDESKISVSNATNRDAVFSSELLGCFGASNLVKTYERYTESGTEEMRLVLYDPSKIFKGEIEDFRNRYLVVKNNKGQNVSLKYKINKKVPFIRLAEMYYIQAQYLGETSVEKGREVLELLRRKRGVNGSLQARVTNKKELLYEIAKDAQKEFIAEGQAFYMFKRLNLPVLKGNTPITMEAGDYYLPIPDVELEFGDRLTNLLEK